jgi:hypothetical protein
LSQRANWWVVRISLTKISAPGGTRTPNPWFRRSERIDYLAAHASKQTLEWKGFRIIAVIGVSLLTFQILWQITPFANRFRADFRAIICARVALCAQIEPASGKQLARISHNADGKRLPLVA